MATLVKKIYKFSLPNKTGGQILNERTQLLLSS